MFFAEGQKCSVWLAANQKCLVLKEDRSVHSVTFAGEGGEDGTLAKGSSKSHLFIFVVFSLVTHLTIKLASQLRGSRTHHNHLTRKWNCCFLSGANALNIWPPSFVTSLETELAIKCKICFISIYTLSDLGVLSNLIGSLSLANEHYSPPTEWIMRKPNKNKMAGVNSRFASVSESIFNGFLLKMLLRSLPVYILKQLFFSISVNSGRIFTSPLRGSVNILPLFTSISKNNC